MIRTILVFAVALLVWGPTFASRAAACISCAYTPEVVNTPHPKAGGKKGRKSAARERPAKKYVAPRQQVVPKRVEIPKVVEVPKEEPAETHTAARKPASAPTDPADTNTGSGNPAIAAAAQPPEPVEQAKAQPGELGCKKFSPTAGTTVPVPCD